MAVDAIAFLIAATLRLARDDGRVGPAAKGWLLTGGIWIVAGWLWYRN